MTIFGKRLTEYVRFCAPFLILIFAVGITRLILSLSGAPNSTARWFSMTALVWIGVLYYSPRVYRSEFGSYKQLLPICALLNGVAQAVAIFAIVLSIFTGAGNIFSAPEYAFGGDGRTWLHAAAHLVIGTTAGSLIPWLIGSLIMLATRKLAGPSPEMKTLA